MRKFTSFWILILLMVLFYQERLIAQEIFGKVTSIYDRTQKGDGSGVTIERVGSNPQRGIVTGKSLNVGDRVTTDRFTSLEITIDKGSIITIKENSTFECKKDAVKLPRGFLYFSKLASAIRSFFRVEAGDVYTLCKSTKFTVEAESEDRAIITVLEGTVEIRDSYGNLRAEVKNGYRRIIENGELIKEIVINTKTEMEQIDNWIKSFRVIEEREINERYDMMFMDSEEALLERSVISISEAREQTVIRYLIKNTEERRRLAEQARKDGLKVFDLTSYEGTRKAGDAYFQMSKGFTTSSDKKLALEQATKLYKKALLLASSKLEKAELRNSIGACYIEMAWQEDDRDKLFQEARSQLEEAVKDDENLAEAYSNLGIVYNYLKLPGKAADANSKASTISVKLAEPWSNKGIALFNEGKYTEAITYFKRAADLDLQNADTFSKLGLCSYRIKNYEDAISYLNKAISIKPDSDDFNTLGLAHYYTDNSNILI